MIISKTRTDIVEITSDNEWEVIHEISTGIFTFDLSKAQDQGPEHFNYEYLEMVTDRVQITIAIK